jgi:hypothetical protein
MEESSTLFSLQKSEIKERAIPQKDCPFLKE